MSETQKFYWLKLREDFLNGKTVDYILSQKNGSEYLAIYLKLCVLTLNNNGELSYRYGDPRANAEVIVKYDPDILQRDLKFFKLETIAVALEIYKKLGLVYEQENGFLKITSYDKMVGSETDAAERMRKIRNKRSLKSDLPQPQND
ncbi:MAG: phage replisome organizer N-terminal domain-containing protein [Clostridiaceae bacterium]|nr:phage replisome organizer N-terminal domain-containing protein [Clostridiaceae bacterium]